MEYTDLIFCIANMICGVAILYIILKIKENIMARTVIIRCNCKSEY